MSGYAPGSAYAYGGAPTAPPYGTTPTAPPYGTAPTAPPYSAAPTAPPYSAAPTAPPYGNVSPANLYSGAPPQPYGASPSYPYGASLPQSHGGAPQQPYSYGGPQPSAPYAKPGKPGKVYGGDLSEGGDVYEQAPAYGSVSPFSALLPSVFPPGTDPNVVACFQIADQDRSGFIDDKELQGALSSYNQRFSLQTVHLLMYLFTSSNFRKIGPKEFISLFYSLQSWRAIFERFDRDRSGKIDEFELREALMSLGFAVPPLVLSLLISKFDKSGGKNKAIEYDNFIECCLTVKGLTEKFKEKDKMYTGSATFTYESFMLAVLPFLIA